MQPVYVFKRDELRSGVARFFNQDTFSDLVLVAPDGRRLKCHRVLLAACSQLLSTALSSGLCNGEDLPVTGVNSDALEAVVRFFYEGRVLLTLGNAVAVMDAAQRLQVRSVAEAARGYVQSMLSARTAVALMVEALQYDLEDLADECLANAVLNFDEAVVTPDFLLAPLPVAVRVLRAAKLSGLRSGRVLFAAAWRWLTADLSHVQHLEELLVHVASPDLSMSDLLSVSGLMNGSGGAAAAAVAPVLQQLMAARMALQAQQVQAQQQQEEEEQQQPAREAMAAAMAANEDAAAGMAVPQPPFEQPAWPAASQAPAAAPAAAAAAGLAPKLQMLLALLKTRGVVSGQELASMAGSAGMQSGGPLQQLQQLAAALASNTAEHRLAPPQQPGEGQQLQQQHEEDQQQVLVDQQQQQVMEPPELKQEPLVAMEQQQVDYQDNLNVELPMEQPEQQQQQQEEEEQQDAPMPEPSPLSGARSAAGATSGGSGDETGDDAVAAITGAGTAAGAGAGGAVSRPDSGMGNAGIGMGLLGRGGMAALMEDHEVIELPRLRSRPHSRSNHGSGGNVFGPRSQLMKGVCQVDGCYTDLTTLREYHQRYKICEYHLKVLSVMRDDRPQRFCQQCGRFHPLEEFDGNKRSCRNRLEKHNARRRKRDQPGGTEGAGVGGGSCGGAPHGAKRRAAAGSSTDSDDEDAMHARRGGGRGAVRGPRGRFQSAAAAAAAAAPADWQGASGDGGAGAGAWGLDMLAAVANDGMEAEGAGAQGVGGEVDGGVESLAALAAAATGADAGAGAGAVHPGTLQAMLSSLLLGQQGGLPLPVPVPVPLGVLPAEQQQQLLAGEGLVPLGGVEGGVMPEAMPPAPDAAQAQGATQFVPLPLTPRMSVDMKAAAAAAEGAPGAAGAGTGEGEALAALASGTCGERSPTSSGMSEKARL